MSKGSQTKLQIAVSLSHRTDYILMDEPTSGLDSTSRDKVLDLVREYVSDEDHTVVIASHDTSFIDVNADYVLLLDGGRQVLFDDMNSIRDEYGVVEGQAGSVPQSYIFGEESGPYSHAVFVKRRTELSHQLPELTVEGIRLCDLVAHCRGLRD
jgi:ABC-2 type transport system ATP-binding protein